ncbi:MAG: hypothetical protein WA130_22160 [Candidatus Methanoperedens sp.]
MTLYEVILVLVGLFYGGIVVRWGTSGRSNRLEYLITSLEIVGKVL